MNYNYIYLILIMQWGYSCADPIVSFFIRPYPEVYPKEYAQEMCDKLSRPGKICHKAVRAFTNEFTGAGIIATYAGFLAVSDLNGHVIFPRKHASNTIYLAITSRITPITITSYLVDHWEFEPGTPVHFYKLSRKEDEQSDMHYWEVTQESVPTDQKIPLETIIIIANPKYIVVPTGVTLAYESPQLILPDIYAKKALNKTMHALYIVNLQHFMRSVLFEQKNDADRYRIQIL